ncbi:MAG: type II toxin-antitoxin system YafQ family toxin [Opitutales bacterium]|nr:type II toxin-antitoxin system YafQ family toxin [Opitutales bacterium]
MRLAQTAQFKKDLKKQIKRGKNPEKILEVVRILQEGKELPEKYKDHPLRGRWLNRRDCHIEPDWILIYRVSPEELRLERTGTHSDLF